MALARPRPETPPTLAFRAKKIPTDKGWDFDNWWSRRELNPRPKAITGQFYMCSCLIWFLRLRRAAARSNNRQPLDLALGRVARLKASR